MLVLNRKLGERIVIGNDIVVTVVGIHGSRVTLGFQCPDHVPVHREEVHRRIRDEQSINARDADPSESSFFAEFA